MFTFISVAQLEIDIDIIAPICTVFVLNKLGQCFVKWDVALTFFYCMAQYEYNVE